jgi:hypothetical protein
LAKQCVEGNQTGQKLQANERVVDKQEASQAVVAAIKTGQRDLNTFVKLLIDDRLDYENKKKEIIEKKKSVFDRIIFPLKAKWFGTSFCSIELLDDLRGELNLFLQESNLLPGNLCLKGKMPTQVFFEQLASAAGGSDFFEFTQDSSKKEQLLAMQNLVHQDESARDDLIAAIKTEVGAKRFLAEDHNIAQWQGEKSRLKSNLDQTVTIIHDQLNNPALRNLAPDELDTHLQMPNKAKPLAKKHDELTEQLKRLSSLEKNISEYCTSYIQIFFENLAPHQNLWVKST